MTPAEVLEAVFPASECQDDRAELSVQLARAEYEHRVRRGAWTWIDGSYISYHTYMQGDAR